MRLIPPSIPDDGVSEGERLVFEALARSSGTDGWVVMHSLDLAHHRRQLAGEIDFLIIVPSKGVLVLEVKGAHRLRRRDGLWFYGRDRHPDERGPFKQASEAMHSLHDQLVHGHYHQRHAELSATGDGGHTGDHRKLSSIPFWSAVCFPFIDFSERSEEWHPWQVIDRRAMTSRPLAALCERVLDEARRLLVERHEPWFRPDLGEPTPAQVDDLVTLLRGDFEVFESPKSRSRRLDDEVRRYTEEQFEALDAIDGNPRIVFDGPAGTGKTLIAVEAARRGAQQGRRVLLLCFNRPLGRWLQDETADLRPVGPPGPAGVPTGSGVVTRTVHEHMRLVAGIEITSTQRDSSTFWQDELPERAALALLEGIEKTSRADSSAGYSEVYDEIVLDEAQDVLRRSYLDFLDLSLRGGLAQGIYRFFGDFGWQRIYDAAALTLDELLGPGGPCAGAVRYELRVNCRNTPRVAGLACQCGGVVPGYARVRRPDDEIEPDIRFWRDEDDQRLLLAAVLDELYADGFTGPRTTILSPLGDRHACAAGLHDEERWRDRLEPLVAPDSSSVEATKDEASEASGRVPDGRVQVAPEGGPGVDTVGELAAGRRAGADVGRGPDTPEDESPAWPDACTPTDLDAVRLHSGKTRYASIYRFKGLESPAVVITDLRDVDSAAACSLLYVGCTRALERLTLLAHESLRGRFDRNR